MTRHPFIMPHPPNTGCMTCGKPLADECHDTPYAKWDGHGEDLCTECKGDLAEHLVGDLMLCEACYIAWDNSLPDDLVLEPETQEHGEPYE